MISYGNLRTYDSSLTQSRVSFLQTFLQSNSTAQTRLVSIILIGQCAIVADVCSTGLNFLYFHADVICSIHITITHTAFYKDAGRRRATIRRSSRSWRRRTKSGCTLSQHTVHSWCMILRSTLHSLLSVIPCTYHICEATALSFFMRNMNRGVRSSVPLGTVAKSLWEGMAIMGTDGSITGDIATYSWVISTQQDEICADVKGGGFLPATAQYYLDPYSKRTERQQLSSQASRGSTNY